MSISRINTFLKLAILPLALMISGCGTDSVSTLQEYFDANNIIPQETASGLYYSISSTGNGAPIEESNFVTFHYRQVNLEGNTVANTFGTDVPIAFAADGFIPGLNEGLMLVGVGGQITLYIPPSLSGGTIIAGALIYEIQILNVHESVEAYNDDAIATYLDNNDLIATRTSDGLYYIIDEPGEDPKPTENSTVTVNYTGYFLNGQIFDESQDGTPATFSLTGVIEGWKLGIPFFGTGGTGKLLIPSQLAYGSAGASAIPPNFPLVFDIELLAHE